MKKRLIYTFVILVVSLFVISGCEQIVGRKISRADIDNVNNKQFIFVCNNNQKRCGNSEECNGNPCVMYCQNNQWIEGEYCDQSCSNGQCISYTYTEINPALDLGQPEEDNSPKNPRSKFEFNEDKILLVNGKKEFPIGTFFESTNDFNSVVYPNGFGGLIPLGDEAPDTDYYYGDLPNKKIVFFLSRQAWQGKGNYPLYSYDQISNVLDDYRSGCTIVPFVNVAGYLNKDEPIFSGYTSNQLLDVYNNLKEVDPDGLVWINFEVAHPTDNIESWRDSVFEYSIAGDIISFDLYPIPNNPCGPENQGNYPYCVFENNEISVIGDVIDELITITENRKPVWVVLQAYNDISSDQYKFMAYQAIIHGATGLFYFGYHFGDNEQTKDNINGFVRNELRGHDLEEVLIKPITKQEINTEDGIEYIIKRYNNGQNLTDSLADYIIAVNRNNNRTSKEFEVSTNAEEVKEIFENNNIQLNNGVFRDDFRPFDVHIYRVPIIVPIIIEEGIYKQEF